MLGRTLGRLRAFDHRGVERGFEQLEVGYVRSGYHHSQKSSAGLNEKGTLHSVLPLSVGLAPTRYPKTGLAHRAVRSLPLEVHPAEILERKPDLLKC